MGNEIRRLAWLGDAGSGGGVPGMSRQFLKALAETPVELDWFTRVDPSSISDLAPLLKHPRVRCLVFPYAWEWDSWYGRNAKLAFLMSFAKRARAYERLAAALVREHKARPYDSIIQFSQGELLSLKKYALQMPLLLYPCVHAGGELRGCREEEELSRKCEQWWWRSFRKWYLRYRSRLQRQDYFLASGVIGMSRCFNRHAARDYGLPPERQGVVYHPIDCEQVSAGRRAADGKVRLLFVGRISVRKGLDVLLQSLPGLLARDPNLEVCVIGGGSLWSNYEPLLRNLPRDRCVWRKSVPNDEVLRVMENSDVLLVPSSYEPGGIVVGEALAAGMAIVASDEVGSAENLPATLCWRCRPRNPGAFALAVESAAEGVRKHGMALREQARAFAVTEFSPARVTSLLLSEAERLTDGNKINS